jgi:TRAP-type C4-dicarboxylate transport system permease small subunit
LLDKFEKFNRRVSGWFEWIGAAGLLAMMVVTIIDVTGNKLFDTPLLGATDWVGFFQGIAIAFACAMTLIVGRHVRVELLVNRLPNRTRVTIDSIALLLGLGLFVLIVWRLIVLGNYFQAGGETTPTAHIPRFLPAYGIALASITVCLVFLQRFINSLTKVRKK